MSKILTECGTPANEPKLRGLGKGRTSVNKSKKEDRPIIFKTEKPPKPDEEIVIKIHIDDNGSVGDVQLKGKILSNKPQEDKNSLIEWVKKLFPRVA